MVEDFSQYTKLAKEEVLDLREVDLNITVQNLEHSFQEKLKESNGKIINNGLPSLLTSSSMIYVTLKYLVDNGLTYNKSAKPVVELFYEETGELHRITVSDNGIGIEEEYQEHIFEMFKRLHSRVDYKGSGIGLSIVKLIVEKLQGKVLVESALGQGSKCIVELPKT